MKQNNDEEKKIVIPKKSYSEQELFNFNLELSKYLEMKTLRDGTVLKIYDYLQYHKDQGSLGQYGGVILHKDAFGDYIRPSKYEEIEEKINQWSLWKFRNETSSRRRLEGLQQLADGMNINKNG